MPPFLRWYESSLRGRRTASVVYAAGAVPLVTEVEDYFRYRRYGKVPHLTDFMDGKTLTWPALLTRLRSSSIERSLYLVIVRDGHLVNGDVWRSFHSWYRQQPAFAKKTHDLLVTSSERYHIRRDPDDPRYLPFVKEAWGSTIDCRIPTDRLPRYAELKLGQDRARANVEDVARAVTVRCGYELPRLRAEIIKLQAFCGNRPITLEDVETVVTPSPGELFVDALASGDRPRAAAMAPSIGSDSINYVLASLEWRVTNLYLIHVAKNEFRRISTSRIADRTGLPYFVVQRDLRLATTYDISTVKRRLFALVRASRAARAHRLRAEWVLLPLVAAW